MFLLKSLLDRKASFRNMLPACRKGCRGGLEDIWSERWLRSKKRKAGGMRISIGMEQNTILVISNAYLLHICIYSIVISAVHIVDIHRICFMFLKDRLFAIGEDAGLAAIRSSASALAHEALAF